MIGIGRDRRHKDPRHHLDGPSTWTVTQPERKWQLKWDTERMPSSVATTAITSRSMSPQGRATRGTGSPIPAQQFR